MDVHGQLKKDRTIKYIIKFLDLYAHISKFSKISKIYKSRKYHSQKENKKCFNHYKTYNDFPEDKRSRSRSPLKRINSDHLKYIISEIEKTVHYQQERFQNYSKITFKSK